MTRPTGAVTYGAVLHLPGAPRAFTAAILGRLSYAVLTVALLLTVRSATDSYAAAGTSIGVFGVAGILMPVKSRLVGRFGQRHVLPILSAGFATAAAGLSVLSAAGLNTALPYVGLSGLLGLAAPPLGPSMRALWAALTPDLDLRQRAYGLDTTVESTLFALGPVLAGALVTAGGGSAALAVMGALNLAGSLGLATSSAAAVHAPPRRPGAAPAARLAGPLRARGFVPLLAVLLALGLGLGPLDLAVVARAEGAGRPGSAGWLLGAVAAGGVVGGLLWSRGRHRRAVAIQLAGLVGASALGLLLVAGAPTLPLLGVALLLSGLVDAPTFVVAYLAADALAGERDRTEATTWVNTAANTGLALGAAAAGAVIDRASTGIALVLGAVVLAGAAGAAVLARHRLEPGTRQGAEPSGP